MFGVSVSYHWGQGVLRARLEPGGVTPFDVSDVSGRYLFTIELLDTEEWLECGREAAEAVRKSLRFKQLPGRT